MSQAVYAFYSGSRGPQHVTYVGTAGKLKQRIIQHLIRWDSSVATGTSAASLSPYLSQPLHNTLYDAYNRMYHKITDGIINDEILDNLDKIKIYPIKIKSENDLAKEIARIANLSLKIGRQLNSEAIL